MSDRVQQQGSGFGEVPVFSAGWAAEDWEFAAGDAFWARVESTPADSPLVGHLDAVMTGKSVPRVWLILHEPGQPELSAAVALTFARELAARDQVALVLDCDDQAQSLTRWVERIEREGWIDLARYGTSVLTSGVPTPFAGRRGYVLGVGSFAPTDVTGTEVEQVTARLRRQADDLILVAPADHIGRLWAPAAGIRLLCWDRSAHTADEASALVAGLAAAGHGLTGVLAFGEPAPVLAADPPEAAPDVKTAETAEPETCVDPVESADDFVAPTEAVPAMPPAPTGEPVPTEVPVASEAPAAAKAMAADKAPATDRAPAPPKPAWGTDQPWPEARAGRETPTRKSTSGVFWFIATASVVIVSILGAYWYKYVRVPREGHFASVEVATRPESPVRVPGDQSRGDISNHDDAVPQDQAGTDPSGTAGPDSVLAPATAPPEAAPVVETVVEPAVDSTGTAADTAAESGQNGRFSLDPYRTAVGARGWALHLYSFPDSASTEKELVELKRLGLATEVRAVQTTEKGRWLRVYVGSFATRAEALAAAPLLKEKLRTDWANPTRF